MYLSQLTQGQGAADGPAWAIPHLTVGRLIFATGMTLYILIGLYFEERDLVRQFGQAYRDYQKRTPMLIPLRLAGPKWGKGERARVEKPVA